MKPKKPDLFFEQHLLPEAVQALLKDFENEENTYEVCFALERALGELGYSMSWGLDAEPYDLVKLKEERKALAYLLELFRLIN